jgi:hypothetical protein
MSEAEVKRLLAHFVIHLRGQGMHIVDRTGKTLAVRQQTEKDPIMEQIHKFVGDNYAGK